MSRVDQDIVLTMFKRKMNTKEIAEELNLPEHEIEIALHQARNREYELKNGRPA